MRSKKSKKQKPVSEPEVGSEQSEEGTAQEVSDPPQDESLEAANGEVAVAEAPEELISAEELAEKLTAEFETLQDRYLRLAAEYDNFRKRTARERSQTRALAQADLARCVLDALDDLGRVLGVDPETASVKDVITGVELVERKILRELESAGLERMGEVGETFDPNHHEALGSMPADGPDGDHTVGEVLQLGYRFGGLLLRPAKVRVRMWQVDGVGGEG
jgi:molecular chaperone GrpE